MVAKHLKNLHVDLKSLAMPPMFQKANNKEIQPCTMSDSREKIYVNSNQVCMSKEIWPLMMSLI